jgi:L-iditol 2-dehydrogenase
MKPGPTMWAAQLVRPGLVELRERPVPQPGTGELVLRVDAALTCGTDLKAYRRGHPKLPLPAPMGHEFAGTVSAVGPGVVRFREDDAVLLVPTAPCGECRPCRRGRENLCPHAIERMVLGAFGEYVRVPAHVVARHVFPRPTDLPARAAAALEPLACVVHGASRVRLQAAETVVIVGDGPIALLFLQLARLHGAARVLVCGHHDARLAVARELGADAVLTGSDAGLLGDVVQDWTGNRGGDIVIECVGRKETWEDCQPLASVGGEVLLFGGCAVGERACFDAYRMHYEEVELKSAFHYRPADVLAALALLTERKVLVEPLITHHRPLARLPEALELVTTGRALKVEIGPGSGETGEPQR